MLELDGIKEKISDYELLQRKVTIRLIPCSLYPKGQRLNGWVRYVLDDYAFSFSDDKEGIIDVEFSKIRSTSDIWEAEWR